MILFSRINLDEMPSSTRGTFGNSSGSMWVTPLPAIGVRLFFAARRNRRLTPLTGPVVGEALFRLYAVALYFRSLQAPLARAGAGDVVDVLGRDAVMPAPGS